MNKSFLLSWCSVSGTEFLNPWNFLIDEIDKYIFCYINEVTLGEHLKMGAACQENQPCD